MSKISLLLLLSLTLMCAESSGQSDAVQNDYVDLGLSVKWATKNVGAERAFDFGDFFAWGETNSKAEYDWTTYQYTEQGATQMTKYCNSSLGAIRDYKYILEETDDAATVSWGQKWRTPTLAEMNELLENCTWIWHENYNASGIAGFEVRSNMEGFTTNSIFLPAAGHWGGKNAYDTNKKGMYWTSTLNPESFASLQACQLYFGSDERLTMSYDRQIGMTVRPVFDDGEKDDASGESDVDGEVGNHNYVDLGLSVKWATNNIGADSPLVGGWLFAWGETAPKAAFTPDNYKYSKNGRWDLTSKYNQEDSLDTLEPMDDAATCNWGGEWRTPTVDEWRELLENCDWYLADGIYGVSKLNGHTIALSRSTGCGDDYSYHTQKDGGCYWTANNSAIDKHRAYSVQGKYYLYVTPNVNRYWGMAIRPVFNGGSVATDIQKLSNEPKQKIKNGIYLNNGQLKIVSSGRIFNVNGIIQ